MSVQLRPMRDDEFATWLPLMRDRYAEDMVRDAGMSRERATAKAGADIERLFPGGRPSPQQLVYVIEAEGEPARTGAGSRARSRSRRPPMLGQ